MTVYCKLLIRKSNFFKGHVRISDLGLAVYIEPNETIKGRVGTAGYMGNNNYYYFIDLYTNEHKNGFFCI